MTALERAFRCALLTVLLALAAPVAAQAAGREFKVMVFTRAVGEQHASTAAGVKAIKDLGKERRFIVNATADPTEFRADRLAQFRAVVFLNTSGDVLTDAQQAAFEDYYRDGGGFVGIHSAIDTEPDWAFLGDVLGTRSTGAPAVAQATVKVADRVHDASKSLPEYWQRTDEWYDFAANVRGRSHVLATVDETTYSGGTMGFDHPVAWCKDFRGGRSFYTAGGHTAAAYAEPAFRRHLAGGIEWAAGEADPVYSDCGATVLANYEQTKIGAPPNLNEPIGFDQLPDGRILQTARGGQRAPARPARRTRSKVIATLPGVHQQRGRALRARGRQRLRQQPAGSTSTTRPLSDGRAVPAVSTPTGAAPARAAGRPRPPGTAWKGYFQLSRFKFVDGGRTRRSTSPASRRSSRSTTTAARAATSPATSTSTATTTSGSSRATTRRRAAATPAASRRSTRCSPTRRRPCAPRTRAAARSR